jgi:hypothetical protein
LWPLSWHASDQNTLTRAVRPGASKIAVSYNGRRAIAIQWLQPSEGNAPKLARSTGSDDPARDSDHDVDTLEPLEGQNSLRIERNKSKEFQILWRFPPLKCVRA